MAELNPTDLLKKIKAGELSRAYYFYGQDVATVENASKAVLKKHLGKEWRNEITRLDGGSLDISALADMVEICPMFSQWNAVVINDINGEELLADDLKMLTDIITQLPGYTLLVINITGFDIKKGKKAISPKNKKITDAVSKIGVVCECGFKTVPVLVKSVCEKAQKMGAVINKKAAEMLVEACHCDTMQIENELGKLCAYRENEEITPEDVDTLVSTGIETDAFKLSRAISGYNPSVAMEILHRLIEKKEEPIAIISAVSLSFLDMYRARAAMTADKRSGDVIADFGYGARRFAVDNAFRDSRRITLESLRCCIDLLRNADRKLKSNGAVPEVILEKTVTEMLMAVRRK